MSSTRVIAKYSNRRLYDLTARRYITVATVRQLVLAGTEFLVTDRRTQKDITREVLLQVIADHEKGAHPLLSHEFLCSVIRKQESAHLVGADIPAARVPDFEPLAATDSIPADRAAA